MSVRKNHGSKNKRGKKLRGRGKLRDKITNNIIA